MERNTAIVSSHKNIHRGKKQKHSLHPKHLRRKRHTGLHIVITLFTCLFLILVLFFGSTTIVCLGPSVAARDLFVSTVMETSAAKFLARIYFSEDKINEILAANTAKESNVITDVSAVTLPSAENSETMAEITVEDVKNDDCK